MDIINGKGVNDVPPAVYEMMFSVVTHWDLEKIRNLSQRDFMIFAPMIDILFRRMTQSPPG